MLKASRFDMIRGPVKRIQLLILSGITAGLLLAACGPASPVEGPALNFTPAGDAPLVEGEAAPEVVATVNGQPIAYETFQRELARFEAGQTALGLQVADQATVRQQVLDLLIEQELIRQRAAASGISVTPEQIDTEINNMIAENGEEYFQSWLTGNFYSLDEFRELVRLDLLTAQLKDPVINSVPASAEQVHAQHILVNSEAEANEILARLSAGEDFAVLAAEYSVDVTTRHAGGDLGWFPRGALLVPEVEAAAFSLQPGQTSGVVPSAWGYHVVRTLEYDPNRALSPEARQRLVERAIETWRQGLRDGAAIEQLITFTS